MNDKLKKGVVMAALASLGFATSEGLDALDGNVPPESVAYTQETCPLYWDNKMGFCFDTKAKVNNAIELTKDKIKIDSDDATLFITLCKTEKSATCKAKRDEIKAKIKNKEAIEWDELRVVTKLAEPRVIKDFKGSVSELLN